MTVESSAASSGQKLSFTVVADTVAHQTESLYSMASIPKFPTQELYKSSNI